MPFLLFRITDRNIWHLIIDVGDLCYKAFNKECGFIKHKVSVHSTHKFWISYQKYEGIYQPFLEISVPSLISFT